MTITYSTYDKVSRLINYALGEPYGDGETVTDVVAGYAEPGYGDDDTVVVFGNWNPRNVAGEDRWNSTNPLVTLPVRLARSLERMGASIEWSDEWYRCEDCYRAVRSQGDSYQWTPSYAWLSDSIVCHDCLVKMGEDALEPYINNPSNALTWCDPSHVESLGFTKWEPGNPHTYENGWHPGQTDDPSVIYDEIVSQSDGDVEVVFFIDENSQFYMRFSAYVRSVQNVSE